MQSVFTLLKLAQLRWTGHVTRMPDERLPRKVSMENCKKESAHKVAKRNDTKTPLKPREQVAQDRTKWRCLINKGASQLDQLANLHFHFTSVPRCTPMTD